MYRYFLRVGDGPENEVTLEEFQRAERDCGFVGDTENLAGTATLGFSGHHIREDGITAKTPENRVSGTVFQVSAA